MLFLIIIFVLQNLYSIPNSLDYVPGSYIFFRGTDIAYGTNIH